MRTARLLPLAALALALLAAPAEAYVVILKDGSQVITRDQFRIEKGKARFTLQNGTESFLDMREIDVVKTVEANKVNYGTAVVLEDGKVEQLRQATPTPRPPELADLISARGDGTLRSLPTTRRADPERTAQIRQTSAGYEDLTRFPRTPMRSTEVAATLLNVFQTQGVDGATIYQGTCPEEAAGRDQRQLRGLGLPRPAGQRQRPADRPRQAPRRRRLPPGGHGHPPGRPGRPVRDDPGRRRRPRLPPPRPHPVFRRQGAVLGHPARRPRAGAALPGLLPPGASSRERLQQRVRSPDALTTPAATASVD